MSDGAVIEAAQRVIDIWFSDSVDGFREAMGSLRQELTNPRVQWTRRSARLAMMTALHVDCSPTQHCTLPPGYETAVAEAFDRMFSSRGLRRTRAHRWKRI